MLPVAHTWRAGTPREKAIHDYLDRRIGAPKAFVWTKTADTILARERRARDAHEAVKNGNQALLGILAHTRRR
jgi:hypothetical protein